MWSGFQTLKRERAVSEQESRYGQKGGLEGKLFSHLLISGRCGKWGELLFHLLSMLGWGREYRKMTGMGGRKMEKQEIREEDKILSINYAPTLHYIFSFVHINICYLCFNR